MTKRLALVLLCAAVMLLCALSTRGALFWLLFWVMLMMLLLGLASALWTHLTLKVACALDHDNTVRGTKVNLLIDLRHSCPLPMGALELYMFSMSEQGSYVVHAPMKPFVQNTLGYSLFCVHVGVFPSGVSHVRVTDVFGLFSFRHRVENGDLELVVLPQVHLAQPLAYSPGDSDRESAMARAFEDATMPTDLRAFQQGDELKKVHWKLSMRRSELIVRVYEQPQKPDALLLLDCSPPDALPELRPYVRDALCEAAASIASVLLQDSASVRMPLLAEHPVDISASKSEEIAVVQDALARCRFDGSQAFERVLTLETRRMRRTGATAIFTSRLNPVLADVILRMRRMGPRVRVLLAADPEDEMIALLTTRLMRNDVEVETVEIDP